MNDRAFRLVLLGLAGGGTLIGCRDTVGGPGGGGSNGVPEIVWRVPSGSSVNITPYEPAANGDQSMLYFLTSDFRLKKIRARDAHVMWDVDAGPVMQVFPNVNVVLSGGNVVVPKVDLFAFDTATGERRWTYTAPGGDETGYLAIIGDDSTIFSASQGGRLYALDARTGTTRWIRDLTEGQANVLALFPVLAGKTVYVCSHTTGGSLQGVLWAVDAEAGSVRWSHHFQPELPEQYAICYGNPAIWRDLVIEPQSDGRVFAFEASTGAVRWIAPRAHQLPSQTPNGSWVGSWTDTRWAGAVDGYLIVTSKVGRGMIVGYDPATGTERWRNEDIAGIHSSLPALDATTLYLGYGSLYAAFNLATGAMKWRTPETDRGPETMLQGRPIIASDRLFLAGRDGSYAVIKE
jgi:outer membrane protein assembly factor BamB